MIGGEDHVLREAAALIASTSAKYIIASSEMSRNFKFFINMWFVTLVESSHCESNVYKPRITVQNYVH